MSMLILGVPFRKAALILIAVWTLFFFLGQLSSIPEKQKPQPPPQPQQQQDGISDQLNEQTKSASVPFPKELSFILLNWNRTQCLQTIVKHAQVYHPFVTEIVIGNNNPNVMLGAEDFESPLIPLKVVNYPQNRYFYARYELCLASKGLYCYMQDDDWDNKYLRSLYANFLRYPHLLHSTTNAYVHYLSWSWTFFDSDIDLHTGFSWLGTGAISTKDNVQRFIYTQASLIEREHLIFADMYFATWFNQVPYQLQNDLFELDTTQTGFSNQEGGILRNKLHITKGVRAIHKKLQDKSPLFPRVEERPLAEERYTKSPCYTDECLFMTSVHSFPSPRTLAYDTSMDLDMVEKVRKDIPNYKKFLDFPYNYAVDESLDSSWMSLYQVKAGDFFGLDLLAPIEKQEFFLKVKHQYQSELIFEISLDGEIWSTDGCSWDAEQKSSGDNYFYRYSLTSRCTCKVRFIRFRAGKAYDEPLQVFDISFEDRASIWDAKSTIARRPAECALVPPSSLKDILPLPELPKTPNALREIGNGEIPVTLVVLNWRRTHNFPFIFDLIGKYTFVTEFIIWNNNNEKVLDMKMLFPKNPPPPHVSVRIINSPQNLHDYAKYLSCSMAKNDYCYFQDDDWLNIYFKSQYTSFLRHPHLFHSMTIPIIYLEHRRWNIYDSRVGLHAGFSWLGVGSFTSKKRVQRFLHQCSMFNLNQDELLQADLFFSYFNNDYPVELATVASQLDQSGAWSTSVDQWGIVYRRLQLSSGKVFNYLKSGNNDTLIPASDPSPAYEDRDIRSPCHTDNCLFITNSYPFPYPNQVTFNTSITIKEQETVYNNLNWPTNWFWMYNSYDRAVDEDIFTAWSSYQVAKQGDYFGLDLLTYKHHSKITVVIDHELTNYDVMTSSDAGTWNKVKYVIDTTESLGGALRLYTITLPQKPYRLIKFSLKAGDVVRNNQIMSVYELSAGEPFKPYELSRNKVENPSFEDWASHWNVEYPPLQDFDRLQDEKGATSVTGIRSLVFTSTGVGVTYSASQEIQLAQFYARGIIVSLYSKAENVENLAIPGAGYCVTIHLAYESGGTEWSAHTYVFNPGTHGWQPKIFKINPAEAVRSITVQLLFQNHKGTVHFDEVSVQEIL